MLGDRKEDSKKYHITHLNSTKQLKHPGPTMASAELFLLKTRSNHKMANVAQTVDQCLTLSFSTLAGAVSLENAL